MEEGSAEFIVATGGTKAPPHKPTLLQQAEMSAGTAFSRDVLSESEIQAALVDSEFTESFCQSQGGSVNSSYIPQEDTDGLSSVSTESSADGFDEAQVEQSAATTDSNLSVSHCDGPEVPHGDTAPTEAVETAHAAGGVGLGEPLLSSDTGTVIPEEAVQAPPAEGCDEAQAAQIRRVSELIQERLMNGGATLSHHGIIDPELLDLLRATSRALGPPPPPMRHTQPGFFASSGSAVMPRTKSCCPMHSALSPGSGGPCDGSFVSTA